MWGRVLSSYSPGSLDLFLLDVQSVGPALFGNVLETLARDGEPGLLARELLEALEDLIAINRVELDEACPAAGLPLRWGRVRRPIEQFSRRGARRRRRSQALP